MIKKEIWPVFLKILDIDCIIDFITYKPDAVDPLSSNNRIFDNVKEKLNINDYISTNFTELTLEKRKKILKGGFNAFRDSLVEKSIFNEKEEKHNNILIFCNPNFINSSTLNYWIQSYYNKLYKFRHQRCCFIEFIILDFHLRESSIFNTMFEKLYFYRSWYYKNYIQNRNRREDFGDDEGYSCYLEDVREIEKASGKIWIEEFFFDIRKNIKTCKRMDNFFLELEKKYCISEQEVFISNLYYRFIEDRKIEDSYRIEKLIDKEREQFWENENDFW